MAKKKKTQLKPVARGFATTSLPKKTIPTPEALLDKTLPDLLKSSPDAMGALAREDGYASPDVAANMDGDHNNVEEQYLQGLVDKLQEKTEKEVLRTLKSIEVDRRFSQTLPRLDIDPVLRDQILGLWMDSQHIEATKFGEDSADKAIARLGVNYGVLRRLGFREDRVEECLRSTHGMDLEDMFGWLYLHFPENEIIFGDRAAQEPTTLKLAAGVIVRNHYTPPSLHLHLDSSKRKPPQDNPPHDQPIMTSSGPYPGYPAGNTSDELPIKVEEHIPTSYVSNAEGASLEDLEEDSDPTIAYVRLKLLHDDVSSRSGSQLKVQKLRELGRKMEQASQDYLFDHHEATVRYHQERTRLDKFLLQKKLGSSSSELNSVIREKPRNPPSTAPNAKPDVADEDSDGSSGMLGILEDPDPTEITVRGITLALRDMSLPKHWSGPMPKTLLRDFVAKVDRYAAISYTIISHHSRAKRASVNISWQSRRRDEWLMDDVACPEDSQAEQFISAIALHSLTYPLTEGFATSAPSSSSASTSFRLLPAVYRELWEELEKSRKLRDQLINRTIWAKLRTIIEEKMGNNSKPPEKLLRLGAEKSSSGPNRTFAVNRETPLDPLAIAFQTRQSTPAYQQMLSRRNDLPIAQYRKHIIEILEESQVLVLSGETGCGKSTQVPSFILEDQLSKGKPCKVYCTEPRRISAISLAQRVAYELCDPPNSVGTSNSLVGYSIRLESKITRNTHLAFVTNGIALRMLEGGSGHGGQGTAFDEITHLIIDEVHERTIESDFLLIVLKTLLVDRPDLKVILMSATVDADKISAYFGNCHTLHVPGRTYPVNVQYLEDAIEYTGWTLSDNSPYARRSHDKYYQGKSRPEWAEDIQAPDEDDEDEENENQIAKPNLGKRYSPQTVTTLNTIDERLIPFDLIIHLLEKICYEDEAYRHFSLAVLVFMPGLGEIRRLNDLLVEHPLFGSNEFLIYPLHSTLSSEGQGAVFEIPPTGIRKIVIATNIAETGVTIPDITCVIDTGKHREMRFDEKRQISRLVETFIARSNAAQRRGRAGRVQQGLCFHLFTKLRHDTQMADSPLPEMMRLSLSDLALRIKIMKVKLGSTIEDVLARALDPPISINVQRAVSVLVEVRALTPSEEITPMGKLLSKLPTDVHLGKFLLISTIFRCLDPALTIAATLNSKSPFLVPFGLELEADRAKKSFRVENSDFLTIHNAFSSWRRACANPSFARNFCRSNFLSHQNLQQIEDLRQQFLGYLIDSSFIQVDESFVRDLSRARYVRNRTRFVAIPPELDINSGNPVLVNAALVAGLYPKILSIDPENGQMRTISNQNAVFHPSSVNFGRNQMEFGVSHLAYFTLMHSKKLYAWETGPVDDLSLLLLCGECDFKMVAGIAAIDRKIKFRVPPRTNLALKILRTQLNALLAQQFQGKPLTNLQTKWMEFCLLAIGKVKLIE